VAHESLQRAWAQGRPAVGGWVSRAPDFVIDMFRRAGYDFIGIDCQHTPSDESAVAALLAGLAPGGPPAFVRVSKNDPSLIGLIADAGADGVIVGMHQTSAADAARWAARGVQLMSISDRFMLYAAVQETLRAAQSAALAPHARPESAAGTASI
jgi:2-keto-3-deoxy-L-rhamnonate aldolase RhmA